MPSFFTDNDDLAYYFDRGIDWEAIVRASEPAGLAAADVASADELVALYREVAQLIGEFAANEIAPRAAAVDREGVRLADGEVELPAPMNELMAQIRQLDLHGMCLPRELGGMNMPMLIYFLTCELFSRADVSVMSHHSFHGGVAMAMLMFSILEGTTEFDPETQTIARTRFAEQIAEIARGDAWGCMDITEPDAGSDMAALRTRAEKDADGQWTVTGQKIFITSGHGKYHFVIARTDPDLASGLDGLSMFLVPTYQTVDGQRVRLATVDRVEHKLGHHGSATAAITFDRTPAHLIGEPGEGFRYMLRLMNNARLGVGFESIGLCEAAVRMARAYASERPSMGKTIDRHEMIADYLDEMETDIAGLRALAMYGAVHEELAEKLALRTQMGSHTADDNLSEARWRRDLDREVAAHRAASRRVTPLLKYLAAEKAVEIARRCVQIHGGNGYMKEYGAERLLRDAVVMPIYEGTSQIQALMAMKDTLAGVMKNPQEFVKRVAQSRWRALSARDPLERRVARVQNLLLGAQQHLLTRTAADKLRSLSGTPLPQWPRALRRSWDPKRDFAHAMLHAERLTRLLADEAICDVLLDQARRHPERRAVLERYLDRAEPRCRFLHDEITTTGERLLSALGRSDAESDAESGGAASA